MGAYSNDAFLHHRLQRGSARGLIHRLNVALIHALQLVGDGLSLVVTALSPVAMALGLVATAWSPVVQKQNQYMTKFLLMEDCQKLKKCSMKAN